MFDFVAIYAMLESYITELKSIRAALASLASDATASVSISTPNGGSRTVSYIDMAKLTARESELVTKIAELYRAQNGGGGLGLAYPIYCGGGC